MVSFGQPLTWMKTNMTEAKHTSGNMTLAFQLRINMPKDKCNTLPLKYWTPLLWSQRPTWNDWYCIRVLHFTHTPQCFNVILTHKENTQLMFWQTVVSRRNGSLFLNTKAYTWVYFRKAESLFIISQCSHFFLIIVILHQTMWLYLTMPFYFLHLQSYANCYKPLKRLGSVRLFENEISTFIQKGCIQL